jgi:hypothetical protein
MLAIQGEAPEEQVIFARAGMSLRTSSRTPYTAACPPCVGWTLQATQGLEVGGPDGWGSAARRAHPLEQIESDQVEHVQLIVGHVSAPFPPQPNPGIPGDLERPSKLIDGLPAQSQS